MYPQSQSLIVGYIWMQSLNSWCQNWTSCKSLVWEAKGEAQGQVWLCHQATIGLPPQTLQGCRPVCQRSGVPADICQEQMSATARCRKVSSASPCVPLGANGRRCEQTPDGSDVGLFGTLCNWMGNWLKGCPWIFVKEGSFSWITAIVGLLKPFELSL